MKIINFKDKDEREIIINLENFTYSQLVQDGSSDYYLYFRNDGPLRLTWKEFDKFERALQAVLE